MRRSIAIATGLFALTFGALVHADQKSDQQFCASVAAFETDLAQVNAINPHSTVGELRAATDRLDTDTNNMQKAADKMKSPAAKQFRDSIKILKHDVNAIPDDATLAQVREKIQTDVQNARISGRALAAEAGCPVQPQPQP